MKSGMYPTAREDGLLVEELSDETLVYDLNRHEAHCLNEIAAFVWRHCDGRTSVQELARLLQEQFHAAFDQETVWTTLEHLDKSHLLRESLTSGRQSPRYSRRQLVRRLGRIGVAVPVVASVITPAMAQGTLITPGQCAADPGGNGGRCCTNCKPCNPANGKCAGAACC